MWPLKPNHELIPILTIQGHVMSSFTWPFNSQ